MGETLRSEGETPQEGGETLRSEGETPQEGGGNTQIGGGNTQILRLSGVEDGVCQEFSLRAIVKQVPDPWLRCRVANALRARFRQLPVLTNE